MGEWVLERAEGGDLRPEGKRGEVLREAE